MASQPLDYAPVTKPLRGWRWLRHRYSRSHVWIALMLLLAFAGVTFAFAVRVYPLRAAAVTALSVALGPMAGAFLRDYQSCCLQFSLTLLPYCLAGPIGAFAAQLLVPPRGWVTRTVRLLAWALGWFIWFGGAIVSFGHALS